MSHLFSIFSDYAVHAVHDINRLRMLSVQKARQRLDRTIQIYQILRPGKSYYISYFLERILLWIRGCNIKLVMNSVDCELIAVISNFGASLKF